MVVQYSIKFRENKSFAQKITERHKKTSVKHWTTLLPYYYQREAVYSWKTRTTSAWKVLLYFYFMFILPVLSNL